VIVALFTFDSDVSESLDDVCNLLQWWEEVSSVHESWLADMLEKLRMVCKE